MQPKSIRALVAFFLITSSLSWADTVDEKKLIREKVLPLLEHARLYQDGSGHGILFVPGFMNASNGKRPFASAFWIDGNSAYPLPDSQAAAERIVDGEVFLSEPKPKDTIFGITIKDPRYSGFDKIRQIIHEKNPIEGLTANTDKDWVGAVVDGKKMKLKCGDRLSDFIQTEGKERELAIDKLNFIPFPSGPEAVGIGYFEGSKELVYTNAITDPKTRKPTYRLYRGFPGALKEEKVDDAGAGTFSGPLVIKTENAAYRFPIARQGKNLDAVEMVPKKDGKYDEANLVKLRFDEKAKLTIATQGLSLLGEDLFRQQSAAQLHGPCDSLFSGTPAKIDGTHTGK